DFVKGETKRDKHASYAKRERSGRRQEANWRGKAANVQYPEHYRLEYCTKQVLEILRLVASR
ncbi:MAG: hypothetical protein ACETWR_00590, partial [Anaerolineae bacterium]